MFSFLYPLCSSFHLSIDNVAFLISSISPFLPPLSPYLSLCLCILHLAFCGGRDGGCQRRREVEREEGSSLRKGERGEGEGREEGREGTKERERERKREGGREEGTEERRDGERDGRTEEGIKGGMEEVSERE